MAEITPYLKLYKPGGGSSGLITPDERVDVDRLNTNSDLIDADAKTQSDKVTALEGKVTVLEGRNQQFYGPAADKTSSLPGLKVGDTYLESDGKGYLWECRPDSKWRLIDSQAPQEVTYESGWSANSQIVTYEVRGGLLYLNGRAKATAGAGETIFTLPLGFRPGADIVDDFHDVGPVKDCVIRPSGRVTQPGKSGTATTDFRIATISPFPVAAIT